MFPLQSNPKAITALCPQDGSSLETASEQPPPIWLSLTQAARLLPKENGKRISIVSLWRWITHGVRGVRLPAMRFGAKYYTTVADLAQFGRELAALGPAPRRSSKTRVKKPKSPSRRAEARHAAEHARAEEICQRAGI